VTLHDFFMYAALLGGSLFLVQLVLSMLGAGDADIDFDPQHPSSLTGHTSADTAFKLLSLQGLTAFFGMFGLTGLAMSVESGFPPAASVLGALVGGSLTTFVIARIFRAASRLQSSGTLDMQNALGHEATVYLGIAPQKPGKVTLTLQGRLVEADALSERESFATGSTVRVVRVLPEGTLIVDRA
jgi:membrane protein implicated in regulation of membrane protease activity